MLKDVLPKSIVIRTDLGSKSLEPYSLHSKPLTVHNSRSRMHWSKSNNDLEVNDEIWNCFRFNFLLAKVQKPQIIFPAKKYYPNFFGLNNLYHNKESAKLVNHKTKCSQTFNLSYFLLMTKKRQEMHFMMQCCDWFWLLNSILSFWHHLASHLIQKFYFLRDFKNFVFFSLSNHFRNTLWFHTVNFNYFLTSKKSSVKPFIFL